MSKQEQFLAIDPPNELRFIGPFKSVVSSELRLKNITGKNVLFKVKTTAPKRYCVRPNSGMVNANQQVTVAVMLQPFEYDPAEKNSHKFMIQSMVAPSGLVESTEQVWKDAQPSQLVDTKLKCVFVCPPAHSEEEIVPRDEPVNDAPVILNASEAGDTKQMSLKNDTKEVEFSLPQTADKPFEQAESQNGFEAQAELERLKLENKKLSEESLRFRSLTRNQVTGQQLVSPTTARSTQLDGNFFAPLPPILYLVIMLIFGIFLGKFFM